jgi:hypothetical protein
MRQPEAKRLKEFRKKSVGRRIVPPLELAVEAGLGEYLVLCQRQELGWGAMATALRGHAKSLGVPGHAHAKPWAWHPSAVPALSLIHSC